MVRTILSGGGYNSNKVRHVREPKVEPKTHRANVDAVAQQIARVARTGRMGDGKVFVLPLAWEAIEF